MRLSPDWVPAETRHHVCTWGVAQQPGDDGGRRGASFRTGDIYLVLEKKYIYNKKLLLTKLEESVLISVRTEMSYFR